MSMLLSACLATVLVGAGMLSLYLEAKNIIPMSFSLFGSVLEFPGVVAAGLISTFFVSGGIHSIGEVDWLMPPVSWITYFVLFAWFFHRRNERKARQPNV